MKKIASIILLLLTFAVSVNAELNEVRGILTKQEEREDGYFYFIFINENDFPVWLDMEVNYVSKTWGSTQYTKSITLQAGETYEWKPGVHSTYTTCLSECHTKYKAYKKQ